MLRWNDPDDTGSDHGLAIDDLTVTATMASGDTPPTVTSTTPANGATSVPLNSNITVNFSESVNVGASAFTVQCPTGTPVTFTSTPALPAAGVTSVTLDPASDLPADTICTVTVLASQVTDNDGTADPMAADVVFSFRTVNPNVCSTTFTPVYSIQGSGLNAAITGAVTTQGVVVGDFELPTGSGQIRGFYLQDLTGDGDPATSDGIFVFNGGVDTVSLGQVVRVQGTAGEFSNQTQISSPSVINCGTTTNVTPVDITLPFASADYAERFEGMLVRLPQTLYVSEHFQLGRFGQVVLTSRPDRLQQPTNVALPGAPALALQAANNLDRIILDDDSNLQNPDPIVFGRGGLPLSASNTLRGGDSAANVVGVLVYDWAGNSASPAAYRVRPIGALNGGVVNFTAANPRPAPPSVSGRLRVTAANLLNYFNTFGTNACTAGVGGVATDCRGADNSTEFSRQWPKTVANLVEGGADVIGIMEIENDGYGSSSAIQDLVTRLNAATAAGTYAFINADAATSQTNALGTDAIKVGLIYKPGVVTPVGTTAALNSTAFVNGGDGAARNRPALAQAFQENSSGQRFIVVVNHLKSKGSPCDVPDAGDGQGNCNVVRTNAANLLTAWLAGNPTGTGDPDILIMGDLNSYAQEDPIAAIKNAGYTNLIQDRLGMDAYSYVFDGQWGYLDHALASAALDAQVTGVLEWHINADEPSVLDYNTDFKSAGQIVSLYSADRFRSSDHDPVIIGLNLANPLAVTLASFDAEPGVDRVTVAWETVSELGNAGFNLYRSTDPASPQALLAYVPSQAPGGTAGAAYSYDDLDVQPGQTYWYWLEDVSLSGATTLHGPVSATVQAPTAVTLGGLQAAPAATAAGLSWLWITAGAGAALALGRRRRRV
ncbi:MAG: ExeM/NucH family extracellular endonuclease [Anaerolineae bacterium]